MSVISTKQNAPDGTGALNEKKTFRTETIIPSPKNGATNSGLRVRPGTKIYNVLAALASGFSFNRFQAERELRDHVLPSTVQKIEALGIEVFHKPEVVPGFAGSRVQTTRYSLTPNQRAKAKTLLGWRL